MKDEPSVDSGARMKSKLRTNRLPHRNRCIMPLTKEERAFLDAYVYEATHEPFGGPATSELRRHGIFYADLHGLLTGYHREACKEKVLPFGKLNANPPPSPWGDPQQARHRSR